MDRYPLGWRLILAQLAGCLLLCAGVIWGPVDNLPRAFGVGLCAGTAAGALAGFRFPGAPWFSAGLACSLAGLMRSRPCHEDWDLMLLWSAASALAYVLIWPVSQATLIHVFQVDTQDYFRPYANSELSWWQRLLRGLTVVCLGALGGALALVALGTSAQWFCAAAWFGLAFWLTCAFPGLRPEWQMIGAFLGLTLLGTLLSFPVRPVVLPCLLLNDSYWLAGQALSATALGYWMGLWQQGEGVAA